MQKGKKKENWGKPKLIILFRGRPEEAVLSHCKEISYVRNPSNGAAGCARGDPCSACSGWAGGQT